MTVLGLVFNIQKFSVHDGPGIRTIVFLKGCPLRCQWCSNPEGLDPQPTLAVNPAKCLSTDQCQRCISACPRAAIAEDKSNGKISVGRDLCDSCGECVRVCPSKAIQLFGTPMSVDDVMSTVEQDELFYTFSGGGLTLGGGEPLLQPEFSRDLLRTARSYGFETAVETSGQASWADVESVVRYCDFLLYDIKCVDSVKHKAYTGVHNHTILTNLEKICRQFKSMSICVRTPIIPGFNDTESDIREILAFLDRLPLKVDYELLQYHQFGESKYLMVGKENKKPDFGKSNQKKFKILSAIAQNKKI